MTQDFLEDFKEALDKEKAQYIIIVGSSKDDQNNLDDMRIVWSVDRYEDFKEMLHVAREIGKEDFD
jgi:hypothetical protein